MFQILQTDLTKAVTDVNSAGSYLPVALQILLVVGLFFLGFHYFVFPIDPKIQMIVLLSLVFLVGVPHGALDFLVDEQNKEAVQQPFSIKKFVSIYLLRLFAFSLVWIFPWVAFSIFIVFSIYHFEFRQ